MNIDLTALGVIGGLCGTGILIITFWMRFATSIADAKAAATRADSIAQDAKKDAHEAAAALSQLREQIAKEYINRDVLREFEDRLTKAIDRLGDRLDDIILKKNTV